MLNGADGELDPFELIEPGGGPIGGPPGPGGPGGPLLYGEFGLGPMFMFMFMFGGGPCRPIGI